LSMTEAEFPIVMRGYDREAIDGVLRDLRRQILNLSTQNAQLATELREANEKASRLEKELAETAAPSYASVGARAALILSTAEQQALEIVSEARAERVRILGELEAKPPNVATKLEPTTSQWSKRPPAAQSA